MQMNRRYWVYAPGEQANRWDEFCMAGVMALSYNEGAPNDLRSYQTEADLLKSFQSAAGDAASHKNAVRALMDIRDVMKPGDLIFAKKGQKTIVGIGRVIGDYEFAAAAPDMQHRRRVEWYDTHVRSIKDKAPIKTLTDITPYPLYLVKLADICDVEDLYSESQYRLWDDALQKWPIEKLKAMSLAEYNTLGSKTSFCYLLEKILEDMGSVWGGSSYKFGIFEYNKDDPKPLDAGASGNAKYRWYSKYGTTADEAFNSIKARIVLIAENAAKGDYAAIDDVDFSPAIKWKVAFLYQNRKSMGVVDIFKKEMMLEAVGEHNVETAMSQLYAKAFSMMPAASDVFVWARQAWRKIGEEKEMSEDLKQYKEYLEKQSQGSGKVNSYLTVIKKIGAIVNKVNGFEYVPDNFSTIKNLELLWKVYQFVCQEQKKSNGGVFNNSSLSQSYWDSRHGFCSAAVRSFLDFRIESYGDPVLNATTDLPAPTNATNAGNKDWSDVLSSNPDDMMNRLVAALLTKPFAILAGASGTGKSRMVRKLAYMTCLNTQLQPDPQTKKPIENFRMVQVKPNWHDSSDLLGYRSSVSGTHDYVSTDFVRFILKAHAFPNTPFFVCLDEMNLAPVEHYFAEFLSASESARVEDGEYITDPIIDPGEFYGNIANLDPQGYSIPQARKDLIEKLGLYLPKNLFVVGTVNMDDTTGGFSRKVLDRAMTLEMNEVNFDELQSPVELRLMDKVENDQVVEKGLLLKAQQIASFIDRVDFKPVNFDNSFKAQLEDIRGKLAVTTLAFAYRFARECVQYRDALKTLFPNVAGGTQYDHGGFALDHMFLMKILPRLVGNVDDRQLVVNTLNAFFGTLTGHGLSAKKLHDMLEAAKLNGGFLSYYL